MYHIALFMPLGIRVCLIVLKNRKPVHLVPVLGSSKKVITVDN